MDVHGGQELVAKVSVVLHCCKILWWAQSGFLVIVCIECDLDSVMCFSSVHLSVFGGDAVYVW
jgi:hypothetical protein